MTGNYDDIQYLNLSGNQLMNIEAHVLPAKLVQLDLSNNGIKKLPEKELEIFNAR